MKHKEMCLHIEYLYGYVFRWRAGSYTPYFTMATEWGCTTNRSGQHKDTENIDWYQSESDTHPLPHLATSTCWLRQQVHLFFIVELCLIPALQMVDAVVKGQKWLTMLQLKPWILMVSWSSQSNPNSLEPHASLAQRSLSWIPVLRATTRMMTSWQVHWIQSPVTAPLVLKLFQMQRCVANVFTGLFPSLTADSLPLSFPWRLPQWGAADQLSTCLLNGS